MECGPIFLAGADRSGTTLMYALLASHPNIAMAHLGSNMWTFFYDQYGDISQPDNFERCLAALLKYKHVQILNPDPDRIRQEFWQGEQSYARLFALVQDHFAEQMGKSRWGDKTSYIERYADPIFAADPTVKMIHMVRDPRDRYASSIKRWQSGRGKVGGATARWLYSVRLAKRNLQRYPDNYMVVCYETLASEPEKTLREICAFLREDYDPIMLTMTGAQKFLNKGGNSSFSKHDRGVISTSAVGRFRKVLSKSDTAFMQLYAKRDMLAYGYQSDSVQFSFADRLSFYLVDWPTNLTRMVTWRTMEAIQHNFPARFGRTPLHTRDGIAEEQELTEVQDVRE
jgi:hypothetical protein